MKSLEELRAIKERMKTKIGIRNDDKARVHVVVGMATCGIAAGARPVVKAITDAIGETGLVDVAVSLTGCIGLCQYEPIVEVTGEDGETVTYINMTPEKARRVVAEHVVNGKPVTEYTLGANA